MSINHNLTQKFCVLFYNRIYHPAVLIRLKEKFPKAEILTLIIDLGDIDDKEKIIQEAYEAGSSEVIFEDGREEFASYFLTWAIKFNAVYEDKYYLSAALARPALCQIACRKAKEQHVTFIWHGFRGNDQIRMDMSFESLGIKAMSYWCEKLDLNREFVASVQKKLRVPNVPGHMNPYSISQNIWGKSTECGPLENLQLPPPQDVYKYVSKYLDTPNEAFSLTLTFEKGLPIAINGEEKSLANLIEEVNKIGATHGVGIFDTIEDGLVGLKTRAIYENPAAYILILAHKELERLVSTRHENDFKPIIEQHWSRYVYYGLWFDPLMRHLEAYVENQNLKTEGEVALKLFKGNVMIEKRSSKQALFEPDLAIYHFGYSQGIDTVKNFGKVWNLHTLESLKKQQGLYYEDRTFIDVPTNLL